jgi:hypothetical protein
MRARLVPAELLRPEHVVSRLRRLFRLKSNGIVDCVPEALFAADVTLSGLHADVPEQKLDLIKLFSSIVTQPGACLPEIVWRDIGQSTFIARCFHNSPDHLRAKSACRDSTGLIDRSEDRPGSDFRLHGPDLQRLLDSGWDGDRPHVAALPNHVREHPMLFSPLQMLNVCGGHFCPADTIPQQDCDHGIVALTAQASAIKYPKQSLSLFGCQPVSDANPMLLCALDPADSSSKIWAQKSRICCFICQAANGGEAQIYRRGRVVCLLERNAVTGHYGFVECEPRFGTVPVNELTNGVLIRSLRTRRGETVQNCRLGLLQIRKAQNGLRGALAFVVAHPAILCKAEA